jgi:UDP-N-acetylglucosamine:LPS N-acetylglucosamine transferase
MDPNFSSSSTFPSISMLAAFLAASDSCNCPNCSKPKDFKWLETKIQNQLEDPEKAKAIKTVYENKHPALVNAWNKFDSDDFKNWLVEESALLGSLAIDHLDHARRTFPQDFLREFSDPVNYRERVDSLNAFFVALQNVWGNMHLERIIPVPSLSPNSMIETVIKTHNVIAILYRTCGQGHYTASVGIKQFLEIRGYSVHLINGSTYEKTGFPLLSNTTMMTLRNAVKAIHPDLIINTVAHHHKWSQIGYDLNVPTLLVHTDYEVNSSIVHGLKKTAFSRENPALIQYCVPHEHFDQNRTTFKNLSQNKYVSLVKELGFPVRQSFTRETNPDAILALRKELGIRLEERVVLMLGHRKSDRVLMLKLIEKLSSSSRSFAAPLCIVAVCGSKPSSALKVANAVAKIPIHPDIRIKLEEYLVEEKMAKFMKVISRVAPLPGVMISKRGGSTTAELIEMGVFTIMLPSQANEACNGEYISSHQLGELFTERDFVNQISQAIKWNGNRNSVFKSPLDWKQNLQMLVAQKIEECVKAKLGLFDFSTGKDRFLNSKLT